MSSSHLFYRTALVCSQNQIVLLVHTALDWISGQRAVPCRNCEWGLCVEAGLPTCLQVKSLAVLKSRREVQEEDENVQVTWNMDRRSVLRYLSH